MVIYASGASPGGTRAFRDDRPLVARRIARVPVATHDDVTAPATTRAVHQVEAENEAQDPDDEEDETNGLEVHPVNRVRDRVAKDGAGSNQEKGSSNSHGNRMTDA